MAVAWYDLDGDGPAGASFTLPHVTESTVEQPGLKPGRWLVAARGSNAAGVEIGYGELAVTVKPGQVAEASIEVRPLEGLGTLDVTVTWPPDVLAYPALTIRLGRLTEDPVVVEADTTPTSAAYVAELQNGYYTLFISLADRESRCGAPRSRCGSPPAAPPARSTNS